MKVKAAVLEKPGEPFRVEELELVPPRRGEVLVRIVATGVCGSDHHLQTGTTAHPMPVVAGHEGAGLVEEVGEGVTRVGVGDPVVLSWAPCCGNCFYCLHDKPTLCSTWVDPIWKGTLLDGSTRLRRDGLPVHHYCALATFAERCVVSESSCVPVDPTHSLETAAVVGCSVATGVGAVLHTAEMRPGESAAVFGCGGVGLNVIQGAALAGAHPIIAIDPSPARREAAQRFGATATIADPSAAIDEIRERTNGRGVDCAFEAVGRASAQEAALAAARPGGRVVLVGLSPSDDLARFSGAELVREEKTIKGSYYGSVVPARDFPELLRLQAAGRLELDALVNRRYRLEEIEEAMSDLVSGRVTRGVIVFP